MNKLMSTPLEKRRPIRGLFGFVCPRRPSLLLGNVSLTGSISGSRFLAVFLTVVLIYSPLFPLATYADEISDRLQDAINAHTDATPPVIAAHGDVAVQAIAASTPVTYDAPATTDNVDPAGIASCAPASGTLFAVGTTTVTCNASDGASNAAVATTFNVIVTDAGAPVIAGHGTVNAQATSASGAPVTYTPPATSDNVDSAGTASCTPSSGSTFAVGTTTVT